MGFWAYMFFVDLIIPFTMIIFGKIFIKNAPKKINYVFGYRTEMSMKNQNTWEFAHKYCGRLWFRIGLIMIPATFICMIPFKGETADYIGKIGGILCLFQVIALAASIIPTEIALRKNFYKSGLKK